MIWKTSPAISTALGQQNVQDAVKHCRELPEADSVDCIGDELAAAEGYARCVAALLYALGGALQLMLVQPADLDLEREGCHCTNAVHRLCCCLIGAVKQLACLYSTHVFAFLSSLLGRSCLLGGEIAEIDARRTLTTQTRIEPAASCAKSLCTCVMYRAGMQYMDYTV